MARKPPSGRVRVLVVDDDRAFAKAIASALIEDDRLEVIGVAHDGYEALELSKALLPDVMLLDLRMPKLDGIETMRKLKRRKRRPEIVVLTGSTDKDELARASKLRPEAFLAKTVDVEDVVPAVAFTVAAGRARRHAAEA